MFDLHLWNTQKKYRNALKARDCAVRKLSEKSSEEIEVARAEWNEEIDPLYRDYAIARTRHYRRKLSKKHIKIPDIPHWNGDDDESIWEQLYTGEWILTDEGVSHIEREIRRENLEATELLFRWGTLIIALLVALTGLLALLGVRIR